MSKGSEKFAFNLYPDVPRECACCGRRLRIADVGRIHTSHASGSRRTVFLCVEHMHEDYR